MNNQEILPIFCEHKHWYYEHDEPGTYYTLGRCVTCGIQKQVLNCFGWDMMVINNRKAYSRRGQAARMLTLQK